MDVESRGQPFYSYRKEFGNGPVVHIRAGMSRIGSLSNDICKYDLCWLIKVLAQRQETTALIRVCLSNVSFQAAGGYISREEASLFIRRLYPK